MILRNPLKEELKVVLEGDEYVLKPEGRLEIEDRLGDKWIRLHGFLQVIPQEAKEEAPEPKEEKKEEPKEEAPEETEKKEEQEEEQPEEEPKKEKGLVGKIKKKK